jgi:shikimate kinase
MMGSGKSTVGRLVADLLHADFTDSDAEVERCSGLTVAEIFRTNGEESFRDAEADALTRLLAQAGALVVAAGGGAVLRSGNRELMRREATVVWLRAGTGELTDRLGDGRGRPLLDSRATSPESIAETLFGLARERLPLYESVAHFVVDTDGLTPKAVAEAVASLGGPEGP